MLLDGGAACNATMDGVDQVLPPLADEGKALPLVNGSTPWPGVLEQGITRGGEETGMNWTTLHVDDPTGSKCTMGSTASGEAGCQPSSDGPLANARQQCPQQAKLRAQPSSLSTCVSGTASLNDTGTGQAGPKRERLRVSQDTRERTGDRRLFLRPIIRSQQPGG